MRWLLVLAAVVTAGFPSASAQTSADPVRAFRDAVVHKQLYLQDYSAEEEIKATWDGSTVMTPRVRYRALAAFVTTSVEATPTRLRLRGGFRLVLRDPGKHLLLDGVSLPGTITIDLRGTDAATSLLKLRDLLFFKDLAEAYRNVPAALRAYVPASNMDQKAAPVAPTLAPCDCADTSAACLGRNSQVNSPGIKMPHLISAPDADLPTTSLFTTQTTNVAIQVDETGHTTSAWLLKFGDAETARAVVLASAGYSFTPASCHGQPTPIIIESTHQLN